MEPCWKIPNFFTGYISSFGFSPVIILNILASSSFVWFSIYAPWRTLVTFDFNKLFFDAAGAFRASTYLSKASLYIFSFLSLSITYSVIALCTSLLKWAVKNSDFAYLFYFFFYFSFSLYVYIDLVILLPVILFPIEVLLFYLSIELPFLSKSDPF